MLVYKIECFEKKGDKYIKSIFLNKKNINIRKILRARKNEIIDNVKINKAIKFKIETRYNIKIPINKYDCFLSETYK